VAIAYISSLAVERELKSGELVRIRCPKLDVDRSFSLIFPQGSEPAGLEGAFVNYPIATNSPRGDTFTESSAW